MKTISIAAMALIAASGAATAAQNIPHLSAALTMPQAREIALKARAGTITDAELEREAGGSGLRYSFDIKHDGKTFEVGVDAQTGAVLENKIEGPNPD